MAALATQFGIHRETAGKYLQARGIDTWDVGFGSEQIKDAAELYRQGWSLAQLSEKFGINDGTVRARLLEVGVAMRPRKGGRRSTRGDAEER
ncbi:MAG: terminase gpP N-terminus-related DNA-binding protein [Catenulispora sp.]